MSDLKDSPPFFCEEAFLEDGRRASWFWDYADVFDADLSAHAKLVRLYLARRASHAGRVAWPSLNDIAKHCGISRATVKRALNELLEAGWIEKEVRRTEKGDYQSTAYRLNPPVSSRQSEAPCDEGGRLTQSLPCREMTGGRLTQSLPCREMTGVGSQGAYLGSDRAYVGSERAPNKIQLTRSIELKNNGLPSGIVSSLRSDTIPEGPAGDFAGLGGTNPGCEPSTFPLRSSEENLQSEEGPIPEGESARDDQGTDQGKRENHTEGTWKTKEEGTGQDKGTDQGGGRGAGPPANSRELIASLGDRFLSLRGMAERYPPGPQRTRVYALMGRLYKRYDVEAVHRALDALERKGGADDPLRFVAAVAAKEARRREEMSREDEAVAARYEVMRREGERFLRENPDLPQKMRELYEQMREEGRKKREMRRRKEEWAEAVVRGEARYDDPKVQKAAEMRAREIVEARKIVFAIAGQGFLAGAEAP